MEKLRRIVSHPLSSSKRADVPKRDLTDHSIIPPNPVITDEFEIQNDLPIHLDDEMLFEIVDSVEENYYSMTFDSGQYEIENYAGPNCRELDRLRLRITGLEKQHKAVCHRVSDLVLEKHPLYEAELNGVLSLQTDNLQTLQLCRTIRNSLKSSADALVNSRMSILRNFRRRLRLQKTLYVLSQIQALQHNIHHLQTLLTEGHFHDAIELHRESLVMLEDYRQYKCVEPIRSKLKDLGLRIDDKLDNELERSCENFNEASYCTIQHAFELLGSTQTTFAQLQMHYVAAIHRRSMCVVQFHVKNTDPVANRSPAYPVNGSYSDLCTHLPAHALSTCLSELCQSLWVIVLCYHRTIEWHRSRAAGQPNATMTTFQSGPTTPADRSAEDDSNQTSNTSQLTRQWQDYVATKLWSSRDHIWTETSNRIVPIIRAMGNLTTELTFDQVSTILRRIDHFIKIGVEFCANPSTELVEVLRNSIHAFFKQFHCHHLERLRMFIENETWEVCPVKPTFSIWDLQEFRTLSPMFHKTNGEQSLESITPENSSKRPFFQVPYEFEQFPIASHDIKPMHRAGSHKPEEQTATNGVRSPDCSPVSPVNLPSNKHPLGMLFSNTALEVLRLIGRYIQMIRLLRPIAAEVMHCICQVFDYYMYCIFTLFGPTHLLDCTDLPDRLRVTLKRINERLIASPDHPAVIKGDRVAMPIHEPMHVFNSVKRFWELETNSKTARCSSLWQAYAQAHFVGVESVVCLAEILEHVLLPHLSTYLPERRRGLTSVFREQSITAARQLREACAMQIAPHLIHLLMPELAPENPTETQSPANAIAASFSKIWPIGTGSSDKDSNVAATRGASPPESNDRSAVVGKDPDFLSPYVAKISWHKKEAATSPSAYVNILHQSVFLPLAKGLKQASDVDESSKTILWHAIFTCLGNMLLNGFAQIHSCTEEGRNQMLLDVQSIAVLAETDSKIRPFPKLDHLIDYIQAFYLPPHEWEHWLAQTGCCKYSRTQLTGLAYCLARGDRRHRQRLLNAVNTHLSVNSINQPPTSAGGTHVN